MNQCECAGRQKADAHKNDLVIKALDLLSCKMPQMWNTMTPFYQQKLEEYWTKQKHQKGLLVSQKQL